jgi:hypothetical protein
MPAVSFYLKKEVLEAIRARASSRSIPVSHIISCAVEEYLKTEDMAGARKRVLAHIRQAIALEKWDTLHRERTQADADRD